MSLHAPVLSAEAAHAVHLALEWLSLALGFRLYLWQRRRAAAGADASGSGSVLAGGAFAVAAGCMLGAAIGNKLAFWLEVPHLWQGWQGWQSSLGQLMAGQSIVGGLLGGLIGVEIGKRLAGVRGSTGDSFVLPIVAGTALGRVGCFLAGLHDGTFGTASSLPWAMDFGDGVPRHPTQLYEIAFVLIWGGLLLAHRQRWAAKPGLLFKLYLAGYLLWRLAVDGIKPVPYAYPLGLSGIQWLCLLALAVYVPLLLRQWRADATANNRERNQEPHHAAATP